MKNKITPESQGISSDAVIELIEEFERRNYQVTSFMLLRNGHKIAEFCKPPYDIDSLQLWFSVTKSITGIGMGIACDKGLLALDDTVINFFPDKLPTVISDNLAQMRVRHGLQAVEFIQESTEKLRVRLKYADRPESVIDASFTEPIRGQDVFVKDIQFHMQKYISYAAWENKKTLMLTIFYIETPYEVTYKFTFDDMNINIAFIMNVSLNLKNFECDGVLSETDLELLKNAEEAK